MLALRRWSWPAIVAVAAGALFALVLLADGTRWVETHLGDTGVLVTGTHAALDCIKDGTITTPPLSTSILPGITRDSLIQIAQDIGYTVEEKNLIRSDLVTADEIFMTGTAAEVTPIREVDDRLVGPPGPVTKELQTAYLDTCRGKSERWAQWLEYAKVENATPAEA